MRDDDSQPVFRAIGVIRSPHSSAPGTPIQPVYASAEGTVIVDQAYQEALADIDGFARIWLIYYFDRASSFEPRVIPYLDRRAHGLFATRAPSRPNPIGLSVVRLLSREGAILRVGGIDILDRTPLLDIKPYVPAFDAHPNSRAGWYDSSGSAPTLADGRFEKPGR